MCAVTSSHPPWWDVTALSHKGTEREPQTVKYAKFVRRLIGLNLSVFIFFSVPLIGAETADEKQHHAYTNVGKHDTHPDLIG